MSALDALRAKRNAPPPSMDEPQDDDKGGRDTPEGSPRTLKLMDQELEGLNPGEEVTLTVTGRLNEKGQVDVISVAKGSPEPMAPEEAPSPMNPNLRIRPA